MVFEEFYFPLIKGNFLKMEGYELDISRPPLAEHHTIVQSVSIWKEMCFSLFWLSSSMVVFKRNNGFKVLTLGSKVVWGVHIFVG